MTRIMLCVTLAVGLTACGTQPSSLGPCEDSNDCTQLAGKTCVFQFSKAADGTCSSLTLAQSGTCKVSCSTDTDCNDYMKGWVCTRSGCDQLLSCHASRPDAGTSDGGL